MNENEINQVPGEPEKKPSTDKRSPMEIVIAVVAVVLIVAALVAMVMGGLGSELGFTSSDGNGSSGEVSGDGSAETVEPGTTPADGNPDDVTCKGTYTVSDEEAIAQASKVVATMGDQKLTNADLQIYYWMQVVSFLNEYGSYASYFGLDYTQPLDTQMMDEELTWQQYFLSCAVEAWTAYESLSQEAIATGFDQSSADYQTYIATLRDEVTAGAIASGYESLEDMMTQFVGVGSNEEAYFRYQQNYYLGYLYFNDLYEQMIPTDEQITAYFEENADAYAENDVTKDSGNYIDVRHILIMPTGGTTENGTTTYSEEEWEAARVEAQTILDNWLAGDATEETFAELANVNSDDSDGTDGGLYTYVYEGQMVPEFDAWCFDPARQVGDHGMVKTQFGYHVMYFSGSHPIWFVTAQADLENEIAGGIVPTVTEKYEITVDYESMVLGNVDLTAQ